MRFSKGKLCIALHLDAFHPRAAFATSVARIQITPSSKLYLRFYPQSSLKEFVTPLQSLLLSLNSKLDLYCRTQGVVFVIFLFAFFVLYVSNFPSWWITCQKQAAATQLVRVPNSFFLTQILPMISIDGCAAKHLQIPTRNISLLFDFLVGQCVEKVVAPHVGGFSRICYLGGNIPVFILAGNIPVKQR